MPALVLSQVDANKLRRDMFLAVREQSRRNHKTPMEVCLLCLGLHIGTHICVRGWNKRPNTGGTSIHITLVVIILHDLI